MNSALFGLCGQDNAAAAFATSRQRFDCELLALAQGAQTG